MKETYLLIIAKLKRDKLNFDKQIGDIVDDEYMSEYDKALYSRVLGQKHYCEDLIEFFEDVLRELN